MEQKRFHLYLYFLSILFSLLFCISCIPQPDEPTLVLTRIAQGYTSPVAMAVPGDGSNRLFIVDQTGKIFIIDANGQVSEPFLDVGSKLVSLDESFDERGLLGLAFHPGYSSNGRFFVYYNTPLKEEDSEDYNCRSRLSEFSVSANDPDKADPESEQVLLEILQPQFNHDGGQLAFGPDGNLYLGLGDGGGANDVGFGHTEDIGNAQDPSNRLGTILRIDVSTSGTASVPTDNPFATESAFNDYIYAYGLRNPWRFSFDMGGEQHLFCADVGQDLYEEINIIESGGNYGWNIKEGFHCFDPENPATPPDVCLDTGPQGNMLIEPILEYPHTAENGAPAGLSVIGGYVYRGSLAPALSGLYIFGDWSKSFQQPNGSVFVAEEVSEGSWGFIEVEVNITSSGRLNRFLLSFGQDSSGEMYLLTTRQTGPTGATGEVYKIIGGVIPGTISTTTTAAGTTTTSVVTTTTTSEGLTTTTTAADNDTAEGETVVIDVENYRFDADDNNATQVDTVTINTGDTVRWEWKQGVHTITSGEGSDDPAAGELFDEPSNSSNPVFTYTFTEVGTVPYYCRPHESLNMLGTIVVE